MWAAVNQDGRTDADQRDKETAEALENRLVAMYQRSLLLQRQGGDVASQEARVVLHELLADAPLHAHVDKALFAERAAVVAADELLEAL